MKWTITRVKKFIKKGGVIRIISGDSPPDKSCWITRYDLRNNPLFGNKTVIDETNIEEFCRGNWSSYTVRRIRPDYYNATYNLNMHKYEEMKADALDSKNAD